MPRYPDNNNNIDEVCTCGLEGCLEHLIISDVFKMKRDEFRTATSETIKNNILQLKKEDKAEYEKRMKVLGYYIGWAIDTITKLLNVGLIIFSGKMTCFIESVWPYLKPTNIELNYAMTDCPMILSNYEALAPAIGAAILSTYPADEAINWKIY